MKAIELIHGDCIEKMKDIESNSIDMICCDMPYGTTNCKWDTTIDLQLMWDQYKRVTKDNAAIVLFAQTPFDKVLGCSNLEWLRYEIIWEKPLATGHLNAKKMPMKAHENILVFYKKLPVYTAQKTIGHKPVNSYTKHHQDGDCYGKTKVGIKGGGSTERYPRSVQVFSCDRQKKCLHPTQKPIKLIEWLLNTYSEKGHTILDNCMGSGTTAEACKNLGRNFIGIELNEKYFNIASERVLAC
jgi:site-specific DNA-methyltransferase (adenine-specific)